MSSRALRKLQREEEERKQQQLEDLQEQADEEISEAEQPSAPKALNAFEMLNAEESGEASEPEDNETEEVTSIAKEEQNIASASSTSNPKQKKSKKKKKNKKKEKQAEALTAGRDTTPAVDDQMDEIDLALKSLSKKSVGKATAIAETVPLIDPAHVQLHRLLAVESKHLNALNEMKRLFGNVVLENEDESPGTPRRRGRGPQQLDLGSALTARNSPVARGQGLTGLALRRNFLIQGKEEWPKAAGGGLGMELVEKLDDGTVEYRFVHNTIYQDVQRQFMSCVESMDPQRMISMLIYNPYHVSTLLQVSEIAKQQGDHSVSADLLERALFTFGRSVQSSFTNALSEGKARLNFDRPENREFWLAAWRYMTNLGQRGTWRTAYEWAKLILSLDPELDPYCIHKMIDQLAIRGGQYEHIIDLYTQSSLWGSQGIWGLCPHINISIALVKNRLKKPQESRALLQDAIKDYPWIFARLFQELNLDHIPKSIWGTTPRTPREKLDCESYVAMAKDLWNTPEATSLLVEVASYAEPAKSQPLDSSPITLDEARHALLSGIPSIIDCIPRSFTTQSTSSFDPFPPSENLLSYSANPDSRYAGDENEQLDDEDDIDDPPIPPNLDQLEVDPVTAQRTDVRGLQSFFSRFIPWLGRSEAATGENDSSSAPGPSNEMESALATSAREAHEAGVSVAEIEEQGNRLLEVLGGAALPDSGPARGNRVGVAAHLDERGDPEGDIRRNLGPTDPADQDIPGSNVPLAPIPNNLTPRATIEAASEQSQDSYDSDTSLSDPRNPNALTHSRLPYSRTPSPPPNENENETSPVRGRHWLAGRGLLLLKAVADRHGTDDSSWPVSPDDTATTSEARKEASGKEQQERKEERQAEHHPLLFFKTYTLALLNLPTERDRRFILDFALPQGAGREVAAIVSKLVERLKRQATEEM